MRVIAIATKSTVHNPLFILVRIASSFRLKEVIIAAAAVLSACGSDGALRDELGLQLADAAGAPAPAFTPPQAPPSLAGADRFMVVMTEQADVSGAYLLPNKVDKTRYVYEQLRATAERSQAPVIEALREQGYSVRSFLISNEVLVERPVGAKSTATEPAAVIEMLQGRADVGRVMPVSPAFPVGVLDTEMFESAAAVHRAMDEGRIVPGSNIGELGVQRLHRLGIDGTGITVGLHDSGAQFDHEALAANYRGRAGDHNYHWFDPSADPQPFPSDTNGHGSHTTGTLAGRAPGFDIGVAPGAEWIHCRGLGPGASRETVLTCLEFFLAPTDLNGENPRPDLAPDVTNHSLICPFCFLETAFDNLRAAGIMAVVTSGNQGPICGSAFDPGTYEEVLTVGASTGGRRSQIAPFSSRGFGDGRIKPELIAPGVDILSTGFANNYFRLNGTSMAAPQVAGVVALLWSHHPDLHGNVEATRAHLHATAFQRVGDGSCEGDQAIPNEVFGYGFVDAYAAVCGEDDCRAERLEPAFSDE